MTRKYVSFAYPGVPDLMQIRTIILGERDVDTDAVRVKPTLVLIHGFGGSGVMLYPMFRNLMEHYRLVLIDQVGFGGSTRVSQIPAFCFESVEAMDQYQVGWLLKWLEQMDEDEELPPKFYLHGHSYGGYIGSLLACKCPHRIEALFLNSPAGPEGIPADLDVYKLRIKTHYQEPNHPKEIDYWQSKWEQLETPLVIGRKFPLWLQQYLINKIVSKDFEGWPDRDKKIVTDYMWHMILRGSDTEKAITF